MGKKFSFIENGSSRKTTFKKRKQGMMKKLSELVTLCDVKACAVVYSPYNPNPEVWPSREGVEKVVSEFLEVSMEDQTKKLVDQEAFLRQRIAKEEAQLQKLRDEKREFKTREMMWDCLQGDIDVHQLGEHDLRDLSSVIDKYLNKLTCRIEDLMENGDAASSLPPFVVADAVEFQNHDQIPQNDRSFNMDMNLNSNQNMILDLNHDLNLNIREDNIHTMDGNHHQPESDCLATITTTADDACVSNITNNISFSE